MPRLRLILLSSLVFGLSDSRGDDAVFSGPQPRERLTALKVLGFSGPHAGKEVELIGQIKGAPTVLVFVHEITRPAMQLLRPIDHYGVKLAAEGLATHFVWLTADKSNTEQFLNRAKNSLNLKSPVSISLDGLEGPGNYGLNRKVTLTIVVAKADKVVANFAIVQPNETDAPKVLASVAKLLGKPAPTLEEIRAELAGAMRQPEPARPPTDLAEQVRRLHDQVAQLVKLDQEHHARALRRIGELQKQVDELTDALNEARSKIAKLEGSPAPATLRKLPPIGAESPAAPPGKASSNPELQTLMRRLIQPTIDAAAVQEIADRMARWAGADAKKQAELADYCTLVLRLGYGNEAAKQALKKLAGE
jgi:hypothetical protein